MQETLQHAFTSYNGAFHDLLPSGMGRRLEGVLKLRVREEAVQVYSGFLKAWVHCTSRD